MTNEECKDMHEKLKNILINYGNPEYGDCIIDEICWLFGYPTTIDVNSENKENENT